LAKFPFLGDVTKMPFKIGFRPEQVGMMALLYGRSMTRTNWPDHGRSR
jgi:hypothetical protein